MLPFATCVLRPLDDLQEDLRQEKGARVDAEQREASLRSDFNRLSEHRHMDAVSAGAVGRASYPETRSSFDTNIGESMGGGYRAVQSEIMEA